MKALVKSRAEPGLWLEDVPEPEYGINDVLIRVRRTGICGTDVHIERWDAGARHIVVSDPNGYRRELAATMGATLTIDPAQRQLPDVQRELGMTEGFDVGLEMSGSPAALH